MKIDKTGSVAYVKGGYDYGLALLQPCISVDLPSSISFYVEHVRDTVALGVYWTNAVFEHEKAAESTLPKLLDIK